MSMKTSCLPSVRQRISTQYTSLVISTMIRHVAVRSRVVVLRAGVFHIDSLVPWADIPALSLDPRGLFVDLNRHAHDIHVPLT